MTILAAGTNVGDFYSSAGSRSIVSGSNYLTTGTLSGIYCIHDPIYIAHEQVTEAYCAFEIGVSSQVDDDIVNPNDFIGFYEDVNSTDPIARMRYISSGGTYASFVLQIYNGVTYDTVSTISTPLTGDSLGAILKHKVVVRLSLHGSTGVFSIKVNGSTVTSYSGNTLRGSYITFGNVRLSNPSPVILGGGCTMVFQNIIVSTEDCTDYILDSQSVNTDYEVLAHDDWVAYELGGPSFPDGIWYKSTPNYSEESSYFFTTTPNMYRTQRFNSASDAYTGYNVKAVVLSGRMRRGQTGPQHINFAVYSGANYNTYDYPSISPLNYYWSNISVVLPVNPVTGSSWTTVSIASLEFGVKSVT